MTHASENVWPRGVPHELRVPAVTLSHFLDVAALRYPDKPAIVFAGRVVRYAELRDQVSAVAGWLQEELGVQRGDRVLVFSQNCPQYVVAFYAALRVGAAVVPVSPMSTPQELEHFAQDSGAVMAFAAMDLVGQMAPLLRKPGSTGLRGVVAHAYTDGLTEEGCLNLPESMRSRSAEIAVPGVHEFADVLAAGHVPVDCGAGPDDMAALPYTSGTTGRPKGCCHSHRTLLASNMASQVWRGLHADSVFLCVAPLFHMLGLQNGMNLPMTLGGTVVMMPRWDPARAAELIERHRVTVWTAPPAMVIDLFSHPGIGQRDLSSLSLLSGGGAAMPDAVARRLGEEFGLSYNEGYGLTETASFLHANPVHRGKRQCLGVPTQGVDSRIVDPATGNELPRGETGELVTRGQQVMTGYWNNEQANRDAFMLLDGQRFFRTGDLAMVDEEGYFFMRDRLKRMINVSGLKVWPAEVESMMYEHPAIHEACVVGVPDPKQGESVLALVVIKPALRGQMQERDLIDWCRQRMAVYKAPRELRIVDALPKSGTGKIMWRELQEQERARRLSMETRSAA